MRSVPKPWLFAVFFLGMNSFLFSQVSVSFREGFSCRYLKHLKKKPKQLIKAVDKKRSDDHLLDSEEEIRWMLRAKGDQ